MSSADETEVERAEDGAAPKRLTSSRRSFLAVGGAAVGGSVVAGALHRKAPDVLDKFADRLAPASVTEEVLGTTRGGAPARGPVLRHARVLQLQGRLQHLAAHARQEDQPGQLSS